MDANLLHPQLNDFGLLDINKEVPEVDFPQLGKEITKVMEREQSCLERANGAEYFAAISVMEYWVTPENMGKYFKDTGDLGVVCENIPLTMEAFKGYLEKFESPKLWEAIAPTLKEFLLVEWRVQ